MLQGFRIYLVGKYSLTTQNFEFWDLWIRGYNQEMMSKKLHLSINAVKSRRKSLKDKINRTSKIDGDFGQAKAVILCNKELELYKKVCSSK